MLYKIHPHLLSVRSPPKTYIVANGKKVLNMVSTNFLGFAGDDDIQVRSQVP